MEFISKNKNYFVAIEVVAFLMLAVCILSLKNRGEVPLMSWQVIGSFISGTIITSAFLPLCYLSWFSNAEETISYYFKQAFFWISAIAFIVILLRIGSMFLENS